MPRLPAIAVSGAACLRAARLNLLIALLLAPAAVALAEEVSLQQAIARATQQAPLLAARGFAVDAARQESYRAGALPDPVLTVGIDNLPITGDVAFDASADDMTMKKIGLYQQIPSRAKRQAQRDVAARLVDEAQAMSEAEGLAYRRSVADAWIDLWAVQIEASTLQQLRDQAVLASKLAKARYSAGSGAADDALAAEAAVLELDNRIAGIQTEQAVAQAQLARWLGEAQVEASGAADFTVLARSEAQLLSDVARLGPLLAANAKVELSAAQIDSARAEKHPDWSLAASYGQRSDQRADMLTLEVGIGLPLFASRRQDRGIAAREADYQGALAAREELRRQQVAGIRAGVARWNGLKGQVALHEAALLPLARDRSAAALASYRAGGELQPWLEAVRAELAVHLSHAEHLGELGRAWSALAFLLPTESQP